MAWLGLGCRPGQGKQTSPPASSSALHGFCVRQARLLSAGFVSPQAQQGHTLLLKALERPCEQDVATAWACSDRASAVCPGWFWARASVPLLPSLKRKRFPFQFQQAPQSPSLAAPAWGAQ